MHLPKNQLDALKNQAKQQYIPYQRLIRYYIERGLGAPLS
jgi:predicted DNA binding CopG/RHH family protein